MALTPCTDCGRPRRPQGVRKDDYPGTTLTGSRDLCKACYNRKRRREAGAQPVARRPDNCTLCGRQVYSTSQPKPNAEAVAYGGHGKCSGCNKRGKPVPPRKPRPAECIDCGIPLRPSGSIPDDHPGTRTHSAKGRCTVCYGRHLRGTDKPAIEAPTPDVDPALEAFNRRRAERKARQQRLAQVRRPAA